MAAFSAVPEFDAAFVCNDDGFGTNSFRSFVIKEIKSSILSRKRGHAFSGIVIAARKLGRTFENKKKKRFTIESSESILFDYVLLPKCVRKLLDRSNRCRNRNVCFRRERFYFLVVYRILNENRKKTVFISTISIGAVRLQFCFTDCFWRFDAV